MNKKNCWEFKKCGREVGGVREREFGTCPVAREARLQGVHGGMAAGRACWVVAGSMCNGNRQGDFAQKFGNCQECDFYENVRKEEQAGFLFSITLLNMLQLKATRARELAEKQSRKVLVVDDSNIAQQLYKLIFRNFDNTDVLVACEGSQAVNTIQHDDSLALILLDLKMPGMDGWDLLDWLNRQGYTQKIPTIIVSSGRSKDEERKAEQFGAKGYFLKNEMEIVKTRVREILQ